MLGALGLLIGACSDGPGAGSTAGGGGASTSEATSTTARDEVPIVGGTLRLGVGRIASLDPAEASPESVSTAIAVDLLFDGLTELRDGDSSARPALATSWVPRDGGLVWSFELRVDAQFSDGSPLSAGDAERSIERVLRRGVASLPGTRLAAVTGYDAFVAGQSTDLAGVVAVDQRTLEIRLDRPLSIVPELLAAPAFGIVPSTGIDGVVPPFGEAPAVSSGPFRFAERDGDVLSFVRTTGGDAYLDGVELHQHDDLARAYDDFEEDRLDWTLVPPTRVDAAAEAYGVEGFRPFQASLFFAFNLEDPAFADVRFRQAIVQAVDRSAIVNAVYFGIAEPLSTVVPAGVPGHDPSRCAAGCEFDPAASERLLDEAFGEGGAVPEVFVDFDEGADYTAVAGIIEENLEAVGIPVTLRPQAAESFDNFLRQGQGAFVRLGWVGTATSADVYLAPLFHSTSPDNVTRLADPAVDQLLDAAAGATDPDERERLLGEAETAILALAPTLNILQFRVVTVAGAAVRDLDLALDGTFDPLAVWLTS